MDQAFSRLIVYLLGILRTVVCPFEDVEYADTVGLYLSRRRSSLCLFNNAERLEKQNTQVRVSTNELSVLADAYPRPGLVHAKNTRNREECLFVVN